MNEKIQSALNTIATFKEEVDYVVEMLDDELYVSQLISAEHPDTFTTIIRVTEKANIRVCGECDDLFDVTKGCECQKA